MRKSSPLLDSIVHPTVQGVLAATILRPDRQWYLSDLASHLQTGPSSLQRSLAKLTRAGILDRRRDGNRVYYRPDPHCPILDELSRILTKTLGIADPLIDALRPLGGKIRLAFIHGSIAEGRERSESDIDLIVVGDVSGLELTTALYPLQDRFGRSVNFTRYTPKEFREKVAIGNHFLSTVLQKRKIFLIGDEHLLEQTAGRKPRRG